MHVRKIPICDEHVRLWDEMSRPGRRNSVVPKLNRLFFILLELYTNNYNIWWCKYDLCIPVTHNLRDTNEDNACNYYFIVDC